MTDQNVFGNEQNSQETPVQQTPPSDNVFADQLASIVNEEGKPKYSSVEEALKGTAHAQEYIAQLKSELDTLKTEKVTLASELEKRESVEEVVKRLTASKDEGQKETPATPSLNEQSVEQLVENLLNKRTANQVKTDNFNAVQNELVKKFGDASTASSQIKAKAQELGMSAQDLGELAKEKPNLVLELFKSSKQSNLSPNVGGQRTAGLTPQDEELQPPTKSLLVGATSQDQLDYMRKVRDDVYKRLGVTSS